MTNSSNADSVVGADRVQPRPNAWHLWRVLIPRRSIAGRLVWGEVWRRERDGQWEYKKVTEYSDGVDSRSVFHREA